MIFVKLVVTAITLMIVVSGVYVFVVGCLRRKDLPWLIEEELKKTPYGKYAGNILDADHWLKSHNAQSIWMNSYDHIKLHGLWVPAKNPACTGCAACGSCFWSQGCGRLRPCLPPPR